MKPLYVLLLCLGAAGIAEADVWKWVDAKGITRYVETMKPIYTWLDDTGEVHYSDSPDHEDAVSVQLVWHAPGTLADLEQSSVESTSDDDVIPGESEGQRAARRQAEAYYCQRATEIYESYLNAPKLYRTGADGEREYLSEEDSKRIIEETRTTKEERCRNAT